MTISREKTIRRSLRLLGPSRFVAFVEAIPAEPECFAASSMLEELKAGKDVDSLFFTGQPDGFEFSARRVGHDRFKIGFGCIAGPTEGDGGEWEVEFGQDDSVARISTLGRWIA